MRVLVATVVHHPEDARILHREARALVDAGHEVVYAAPFSAREVEPQPWVTPVDLPRALGRRRLRAVRVARREIARLAPEVDVVLLHDVELLGAVAGRLDRLPPVVWDVHEDTGAALSLKRWLPAPARPLVRSVVHGAERAAERRVHLLLAEHGYVDRFSGVHLVVPNDTIVPDHVSPPGEDRVVYVGWLSKARGAEELVETARRLVGHDIITELIGPADAETRRLLQEASAEGVVTWRGFLPNDEALARVEGALAGLSLLRDEPNYRHSMPTKVVEYMARGVPVVTTPLPRAVDLVRAYGCGSVVGFADPAATARSVLELRDDAERRRLMGARGHAAARKYHHWPTSSAAFVARLESWAGLRQRRTLTLPSTEDALTGPGRALDEPAGALDARVPFRAEVQPGR